ncbi:MAG: ribosome maturation factor RimM [Eubacteriales bacterium]|nr:ribosome maturation factor RimM [Eubacteriales bacterium]
MKKIKIGKIVNAVGLKGEVKVYSYSEPSRYKELTDIYVEEKIHRIENVRYQKNIVILKLSGIDDRTGAENAKEKYIYIIEDDLPELPEDTYYIKDLIGMSVVDETGESLGKVKDIIQNAAQDLYEIERANGKLLLIPGVKEFIIDIDLNIKEIKVKLPEGLLEL